MKYWKHRYVGIDFDHPLPCLSSVVFLLCQARSKHTATCLSGQSFFQNSHSPCSSSLQQQSLLKIQGAAWTSLIHLLAYLMLDVTLKRLRWCTPVDTGARALICDTSQWTNRDKGFHADKLSHVLCGKLLSRSTFVRLKYRLGDLDDGALQHNSLNIKKHAAFICQKKDYQTGFRHLSVTLACN